MIQKRLDHLAKAIAHHHLDALLVTHAANRYYLSGFELHDLQCNESSGCLLVMRDGDAWLFTDGRYEDAALRLWPQDRLVIYTRNKDEYLASWMRDHGIQALGIETQAMSVDQYNILSRTLELIPTRHLVENLRIIKDDAEIQALRESCALNHKVFSQIKTILAPGMTEADLAWKIEQMFREQGASELSFPTIVAVGPNGALPHAVPGDTVIAPNTPVLVDMGGRVQGYCSDQTRTFWVGDTPTTIFQDTLKRVQEAQHLAIEHYLPGKAIKEADQAARVYFDTLGQGRHFNHSLGHGVGLETHELPGIGPRSQVEFQPGMVVTAEPGLYYPSWGGVRWEHMVLITEDGHEIL